MSRFLSTLVILAFLCSACGLAPLQVIAVFPTVTLLPSTVPPVPPETPFNPAKLGTREQDVTYCSPGGVDLKMDLYYPAEAGSAWPVVMFVHGGGWTQGDKSGVMGLETQPALNAAGFLVASVDYRLAPAYQFPAMIEDIKCAVRYLRAHADEYHIDPQRIGAIGGSAGGHLVSLLGLAGPSAGWDIGAYLNESSAVQAVVDFFGPADLTDLSFDTPQAKSLAATVFGASGQEDPRMAAASPVTYVQPGAPPFLIVQGEEDTTVPLVQSQILAQKLASAGIPATLVMVENAGHSLIPIGGAINPSRWQIDQMVVDFFLKILKA